MQEKWQIYFVQLRKKALTSFFLWMPGSALFFTLLNYAMNGGKKPLAPLAITSSAYSIGICTSMFVVFTLFWTVATAMGPRAIHYAKKRLTPYFLLAFIALGSGIFAADHVLSWMLAQPQTGTDAMLETFFTGCLISVGLVFYHAYSDSRDEIKDLAAKTVEAQYSTLKSQMQPHFLFNSLNSLSELIEESPARAAAMTEKLADLYRSILANSKNKTSALETELYIVKTYLDLECIRFGKRLRHSVEGLANSASIYLPSLMLQTLVENAVKHGIAPCVEGGEISIVVGANDQGMYQATIRNSGLPFQRGMPGIGTGLENTVKRLDLLYGDSHRFRIGTNDQNETEVSFAFTGERIV